MQKFLQDNYPHAPLSDVNALLDQKTQQTYNEIQSKGGIIKYLSQRNAPANDTLWRTYLLNYEYYCKQNHSLPQQLHGEYLHRAYYVSDEDRHKYWQDNSYKPWESQQISIWPFDHHMLNKINKHNFTFQDIVRNHGNQLIDIRIQLPNQDSFKIHSKSNVELLGLNIADYVLYIQQKDKFYQMHPDLDPNRVLFGVNVDMVDWQSEISQLKQMIPKSLLPQGPEDMLSYLRQPILGVNVPQIYIKVEGVWTGGHQENMSVNAMNFNHGPDDCLWITVDQQYVQQLRQMVLISDNIDILYEEGLWFKDIDYFLINRIPVKYTIQRKGDLVILGNGCLHWVKSIGQTINSAWNSLWKTLDAFQSIQQRHLINQERLYKTVIPYRNLLLDIYLHEQFTGQPLLLQLIQKQLQEFYNQENLKIDLIESQHRLKLKEKYYEDSQEVLLCSSCEHEIFIYFYNEGNCVFLCLDCLPKSNHVRPNSSIVIYNKYPIYPLKEMIEYQQPSNCIPELCAQYTGVTRCSNQQRREVCSPTTVEQQTPPPQSVQEEQKAENETESKAAERELLNELITEHRKKRGPKPKKVPKKNKRKLDQTFDSIFVKGLSLDSKAISKRTRKSKKSKPDDRTKKAKAQSKGITKPSYAEIEKEIEEEMQECQEPLIKKKNILQ